MTPNKTVKWYWFNLSPRVRLILAAWGLAVLLLACAVTAGVMTR